MTPTLSIDLAEKHSAACVLSRTGCVLTEFHQESADQFLGAVCAAVVEHGVGAVLVEDVPHNLKFMGNVKRTCRLQGRLLERLCPVAPSVMFLPPATWQRGFAGVWRKGPEGAAEVAATIGYHPPDVLSAWLESGEVPPTGRERQVKRAEARKVMSDYVDAFLIGEWARQRLESGVDLSTVPTVVVEATEE